MSDQGKNDTRRPSGRTWSNADKVDIYREGRRSAFVEALEVLRDKGSAGLADYIIRVTAGGA